MYAHHSLGLVWGQWQGITCLWRSTRASLCVPSSTGWFPMWLALDLTSRFFLPLLFSRVGSVRFWPLSVLMTPPMGQRGRPGTPAAGRSESSSGDDHPRGSAAAAAPAPSSSSFSSAPSRGGPAGRASISTITGRLPLPTERALWAATVALAAEEEEGEAEPAPRDAEVMPGGSGGARGFTPVQVDAGLEGRERVASSPPPGGEGERSVLSASPSAFERDEAMVQLLLEALEEGGELPSEEQQQPTPPPQQQQAEGGAGQPNRPGQWDEEGWQRHGLGGSVG